MYVAQKYSIFDRQKAIYIYIYIFLDRFFTHKIFLNKVRKKIIF